MHPSTYAPSFHRELHRSSSRSARAIVPWLIETLDPGSVLDVGCGLGSWLAEFRRHGVEDVLGIDGDYVALENLAIPAERFRSHDLEVPLRPGRRFDLVVSMEVAEHLPEHAADTFVESLTSCGSVVLFSAAVPGQPGTNHVHLQWPEYWARQFADRGFKSLDCVRPRFWNDPEVDWWYSQNAILYVEEGVEPGPLARIDSAESRPLPIVHPRFFREKLDCEQQRSAGVAAVCGLLPAKGRLILVDDDALQIPYVEGGIIMPFTTSPQGPSASRWDRPDSADSATAACEGLRKNGATRILFASPAHWWLQHYPELTTYLRAVGRCVTDTQLAVAFDFESS